RRGFVCKRRWRPSSGKAGASEVASEIPSDDQRCEARARRAALEMWLVFPLRAVLEPHRFEARCPGTTPCGMRLWPDSPMKVATWNINSIRARQDRLVGWLASAQPDLLCIQEIKCTDQEFPSLELRAAGYYSVTCGEKSYNGVAIL